MEISYDNGLVPEGNWPETDFESLTTGDSLSDHTFDALPSDDEIEFTPAIAEAAPRFVSRKGIELLRRRKHGTAVGCDVKTVCYGNWKGKPACLAVFRFEFHTSRSSVRFTNASVKISVHPNSDNDRIPRSVHFFHNARKTGEALLKMERVYEMTAFFGGATGINESIFGSESKAPLIAKDLLQPSKSETQADGGVAWTVAESWVWKLGIPTAVETAVIMTLDRSEKVDIKIEINTSSTDSLDTVLPISIRNSVTFSPEVAFGEMPLPLNFEDLLKVQDWNNLMSTENKEWLTCPR